MKRISQIGFGTMNESEVTQLLRQALATRRTSDDHVLRARQSCPSYSELADIAERGPTAVSDGHIQHCDSCRRLIDVYRQPIPELEDIQFSEKVATDLPIRSVPAEVESIRTGEPWVVATEDALRYAAAHSGTSTERQLLGEIVVEDLGLTLRCWLRSERDPSTESQLIDLEVETTSLIKVGSSATFNILNHSADGTIEPLGVVNIPLSLDEDRQETTGCEVLLPGIAHNLTVIPLEITEPD